MSRSHSPQVSVLMAVYNGEDHVCEAVASVLAQSFEDFELIIADDASTDSTAAILAGFQDPRVRIVTNEENLGVTRTRNLLLERARGEFIAVHDHDDISLPERLEKEVAFLRDTPDCVAGSCGYRLREPGRPERTVHPAQDDLAIRWHLLFGNALPHAGAMMRAAAMEAVGGYDERFTCCLDHDLFCRLSRIGRLRNLREPLVIVHKRREGISIGRRAEQQRFSKELNAREMSLLMGTRITPDVAVSVEEVLAGRIFPLREAGTVVRLALRLARSFREAHCCPKFISERLEWLLKEHVKFGGRCLLRGRVEEAAVRGCVAMELAASGLVRAPVRLLAGAALGCLRKPRPNATPDANAASAVPSASVPPPAGPKPVVSVVIITRNRARLLEVALGSLAGQTAPARDFEVIVVDNGPHAATRRTADAFAVRMRVRCVAEPRTGRSYARNTGFALARADYVAYMDDDARAMPSWVAGICRIIRSDHPAVFGGPYFAYYGTEKPAWYRDEYGSNDLGEGPRRLQMAPWLTSANLVVCKDLLERIGGFSLTYGSPDALPLGQDTELQLRARRLIEGLDIWYYPEIRVEHLVPASRMSLRSLALGRLVRGRIDARMEWDEGVRYGPRDVVRQICGNAAAILAGAVGCLARDTRRYRYWQNYFVDNVLPGIGGLSAALERLRRLLRGDARARALREGDARAAPGWSASDEPMPETCEPGLVTVIIPTYNRASLIGETLESVRAQSYRPIEVIVVDDGSSDKTDEVVSRFAEQTDGDPAVLYVRQENRGAPAARNRGLVESRGEFIQFLDSDDLLEPEKLAEQVRVMREDRRQQMVFSQWQCPEHGHPVENTTWRKNFSADRANLLDLLLGKDRRQTLPLWTANTLYRRSLCMRLGPWDTRLVRLQDRLYNLRALLLAVPYRYIPAVHVLARRHGGDRISDHFAEVDSLENMRAAWHTMQDLLAGSGALTGRRRRLFGRTYYSLARPAFVAGARGLGAELLRDGLAIAPVSAIWLKLQLTRLLYGVLGTAGANRLFGWKMRLATTLRATSCGARNHR